VASIGIRTEHLSKNFKSLRALEDVSLLFESGRLHGLIGPDGAGKTTLLRCLIRLLLPSTGRIDYSEGDRSVSFDDIRPRMAYMPQQQSLYPDLTCSEHLDFFKDLYRLPSSLYRTRREELLRITRLDKFQDRRAGQLSGGMYKKLGLMCALLQSPEILLLDEPTNGVDPISRREFWDLLYRLREQRILIIVSTSYMDEAERCERLHLLDGGQVLSSGEPRETLRRERANNFEELFLRREGVTP